MHEKLVMKLELGKEATFVPNKKEHVYNWFFYKEGYSYQLVQKFLGQFNVSEGQWVLDPFCGSGTTLLACNQAGVNSVGVDVMPAALLAARVKTRDYNFDQLREEARKIFEPKFVKPNVQTVPNFIKRYFSKYALEDIVFFKGLIDRVEDDTVREFLLLGLINAAMKVSYAWKDGGVLKAKKHHAPPLRKMYKRVLSYWIKDREKFSTKPAETIVMQGDARMLEGLEDESIDCVITSPPYLNNIDYTKVYAIENWIASGDIEPPLRSVIGGGQEEDVPENIRSMNLPLDAISYFRDMEKFLRALHRVMKIEARAAIVLGNAYYKDFGVIESDIILAQIAEQIGFQVESIEVYNQRAALHERTNKVGTLRESGVILKKV